MKKIGSGRKRLLLNKETVSILTGFQLRALAGGNPKDGGSSGPLLCETSDSGSSTEPTEYCVTRNMDCPTLATACC
jgi:hypothetical protein